MKFLISSALICALAMCLVLAASADENGFTYALNSTGDGYSITGYTGSDTAVTVPDWYMGLPVTAIGDGAFQGNTAITSVALPSSITRIGAAGFKGCTSLTTISSYAAGGSAIRIPGDADDNGAVDINDALQLLRYDAGEAVAINTSNADVNADGTADVNDALILLQYEAGWDVQLK